MSEKIEKKFEELVALIESEKNVNLCEIKNQARFEKLTATIVAGIRVSVEDFEMLSQLKHDVVELISRYFVK